MSNVVSKVDKNGDNEPVEMDTILLEQDNTDNENKDKDKDSIKPLLLQKMFELFLNENKEELEKYKIVLCHETQVYLLELCKENPNFFIDVENSLNQIIVDNEINAKDIPDILYLIIKIYGIIKHKEYPQKADPYLVIELLVQILLVIHLKHTNKMENVDDINASIEQIISIIRVAVELLKLPIIKMQKKCFLTCIFKK